jgi:toxin YoeB
MEAYFNELSVRPRANSLDDARSLVLGLLTTMNALKGQGHKRMRTKNDFVMEEVTDGYSFLHFMRDELVPRDRRILLQSIIDKGNPLISSATSDAALLYQAKLFETPDHSGLPELAEGLGVAFLHQGPAVSLASHEHWRRIELDLTIYGENDEISHEKICNYWELKNVADWIAQREAEIPLNSEANIDAIFPTTLYDIEPRAKKEMLQWYYDDPRYQIRIKELIEDIQRNPFTGGKGLTETLKGQNGMASKRIVGRDRLVYTYTQEKITIHSCRGHYDDH